MGYENRKIPTAPRPSKAHAKGDSEAWTNSMKSYYPLLWAKTKADAQIAIQDFYYTNKTMQFNKKLSVGMRAAIQTAYDNAWAYFLDTWGKWDEVLAITMRRK
jgi:hypothetical protein